MSNVDTVADDFDSRFRAACEKLFALAGTRDDVDVTAFEKTQFHVFHKAGCAARVGFAGEAHGCFAVTPHDFGFDVVPVGDQCRSAWSLTQGGQVLHEVHAFDLNRMECFALAYGSLQFRENLPRPVVQHGYGDGPGEAAKQFRRRKRWILFDESVALESGFRGWFDRGRIFRISKPKVSQLCSLR